MRLLLFRGFRVCCGVSVTNGFNYFSVLSVWSSNQVVGEYILRCGLWKSEKWIGIVFRKSSVENIAGAYIEVEDDTRSADLKEFIII